MRYFASILFLFCLWFLFIDTLLCFMYDVVRNLYLHAYDHKSKTGFLWNFPNSSAMIQGTSHENLIKIPSYNVSV